MDDRDRPKKNFIYVLVRCVQAWINFQQLCFTSLQDYTITELHMDNRNTKTSKLHNQMHVHTLFLEYEFGLKWSRLASIKLVKLE